MVDAAFAEDGHLNRDSELDVADHAIPTPMQAPTTTPLPERKLPQHDGVAAFKDLGIGDARVGHVDVHARGAVPGGTGAGAAGDGFVVAEAFCGGGGGVGGGFLVAAKAEGEVVAVALGGGAGGEGAEDYVGDALGLVGEGGGFSLWGWLGCEDGKGREWWERKDLR